MGTWTIDTSDEYDEWYENLDDKEKEDVLAASLVLKTKGPGLGRPHVDTVSDSEHSNMKELRVQHQGKPYRIFFAFDPNRNGILLCGGRKDGAGDKKFYEKEIKKADAIYSKHLKKLKEKKPGEK
ncbi:MAG: addiction module toxin RelE [Methylotenera sp.]|nr:MAG: addiction module toxin RelE [Methylotenera sp.]